MRNENGICKYEKRVRSQTDVYSNELPLQDSLSISVRFAPPHAKVVFQSTLILKCLMP